MKTNDFIQNAQKLKNAGNYLDSLIVLGKALEKDKMNKEIYYSIGKIYYLLKDRNAAVKNYLIALHLFIEEMVNSPDAKAADVILMDLPVKTKKELLKIDPKSLYIMIDVNTPRHIAHAFIDYNKNIEISHNSVNQYIKNIRGSAEEQPNENDNEFTVYYMTGISFCVNIMDFSILLHEIPNYYSNLDEMKMEQIFESVYNDILESYK